MSARQVVVVRWAERPKATILDIRDSCAGEKSSPRVRMSPEQYAWLADAGLLGEHHLAELVNETADR